MKKNNKSSKTSDASLGEQGVKPLIDAAYSEQWKGALDILFISGSILSFSEEIPIPVVIGFEGSNDGNEKLIDLYEARMKTELLELISPLLNIILPPLFNLFAEQKVEETESGVRKVMLVAIESIMNENQTMNLTEIFGNLLVKGLFSFSSIFAAQLYKILWNKMNNVIKNTLEQQKYQRMLENLRQMNFITPLLRVSLCGNCGDFEFTLSSSKAREARCPSCGANWGTLTLFRFNEIYSNLKANTNNDLPLFITSYLRHELALESTFGNVEIFPFKVFNSNMSTNAEVDVWIPSESIGIECKVYEEWNFPLTRNRIGSISGDLVKQLKNYDRAGIERVFVVTNLGEDALEKVSEKVLLKTREFSNVKDVEVLGRNKAELFSLLGYIKEQMSDKISLGIDKMISNKGDGKSLEDKGDLK